MPLCSEQRELVLEATRQRIIDAEQKFGKQFPTVEIVFNVRGATWGYYLRKGKLRQIRYNEELFVNHFDEGIADTVPHEVAHFVVDSLFKRRKVKPHGKEWREVMRFFGIPNPRATHNTDLSGIDRRQQRRFQYECRCGPVMLSTTRHFRVLRGQSSYSCRRCGNQLQPVKET